jgi:hypothetical protein
MLQVRTASVQYHAGLVLALLVHMIVVMMLLFSWKRKEAA